jgi:hypothetical protein
LIVIAARADLTWNGFYLNPFHHEETATLRAAAIGVKLDVPEQVWEMLKALGVMFIDLTKARRERKSER